VEVKAAWMAERAGIGAQTVRDVSLRPAAGGNGAGGTAGDANAERRRRARTNVP